VQALARFDSGSDVAEHLTCLRPVWPSHAAKGTQQVVPGPPQESLAARIGPASQ